MLHKRTLAWLLALVWMLPASGLAARTWEAALSQIETERYTEFDTDVPDVLREPLAQAGFDPSRVLCGAMREIVEPEGAAYGARLLLAAEKDGETTLVGGVHDGQRWSFTDLGEKLLLPGRAFAIRFLDRSKVDQGILYVEYAPQGGVVERYGFQPGMSAPELWVVCSYEREGDGGAGLSVRCDYGDSGLRVTTPGATWETGTRYPVYGLFWCRYMQSIADYPTGEVDAQALAQKARARFAGTDLVMLCGDVNLREKPTGASKSLGQYAAGTLAHKLGEEPGKHAPWVHVRVGDVEGYASGVYVHTPDDDNFFSYLWHMPLALARTQSAVPLRQSPLQTADAVAQLPAGTAAHVMGHTSDGWLHVMVPNGQPSWEMDVDGTSGYVREEEVELGVV